MPPKRAAAKRARTPEPDQPAARAPISEPRRGTPKATPTATDAMVATLLAKHPKKPMEALWEVLTDPTNVGPELAMGIVNHKSCGLERKTTKKDGTIQLPNFEFLDDGRLEIGATPLLIALFADRPDVAAALVSAGANVLATTSTKDTALHLAALHGNLSIMELALGMGVGSDAKNDMGQTPLHLAANDANTAAIAHLIAKVADVNAKDIFGLTPLCFAAQHGHTEAMKLLISNRAEVNPKVGGRTTPFLVASQCGQTTAVELLATHGADVNANDVTGSTALHYAADAGHEGIVAFVISARGDINAADNVGNMALHLAVRQRHLGCVELLINKSADVNAKNNNGFTPLQLANITCPAIAARLIAAGATEGEKETTSEN